MRYIDFDGVIMDTGKILFEGNIDFRNYPDDKLIEYIQLLNWRNVLMRAKIINNSIEKLRNMNPNDSAILTKVHSFENEALAKLEFLRSLDIKQSIIFVPYFLEKTDVVNAEGNILIDDSLKNLKLWYEHGGYPMFFDINNDGIDPWGYANTMLFQKTRSIDSKKR